MNRDRVAWCAWAPRLLCPLLVAIGAPSVRASAGWAGGAAQESQPGPRATMTLEDLLDGVEMRDSVVRDLTVSYRYDYDENDPVHENGIMRTHQTITTKGELFLLDQERWSYPPADPNGVVFHYSYDGRFSTSHLVGLGQAHISDRRTLATETQGQEFFNMMMLNEPRLETVNGGVDDQSLISLLRNPNARLRPVLEEVDGHMTHVVEVIGEYSGELALVVWIDPERGYLPLRQQFYRGGELSMEFVIEEAAQVWNQAQVETWYVTKGRKWVAAIPGILGMEEDSNWVLEVDGWDTDEPQIFTNTDPGDEEFRIWQNLPVGTLLVHMDSRMMWTVEEALGETVLSSLRYEPADYGRGDGEASPPGEPVTDAQGDDGADDGGRLGGADENARAESGGDGSRSSGAGAGGATGWSPWLYVGGVTALVAVVGVVVLGRRGSR